MRFIDPFPPSSPSIDEQMDALRKGLGRTMLWAVAGKLDEAPLLHVCLHDQRHDRQVEDARGSWLWQLVQATGGEDRFRSPLLEELQTLPDERSAFQLCELAYFYAARGDDSFRRRLYEIVEQQPVPSEPGLGEKEILRLDGVDAFIFAAGVRGRRLESQDWDWYDDNLIDDFIEQLGEEQVSNLLKNTNDSNVQLFYNAWLNQRIRTTGRQQEQSRKQEMQAIRVDDIIAEAKNEQPAFGGFRGWGMHASDEDLNTVLQSLWSAKRPKTIISYLRVLSNRAMPTFDARIIEFCNHSDEQVRHWAFNALKMNNHPLVREFAVRNIQHGLRDRFFGGLFIRNYKAGDENLLLEALELPVDSNNLHWLLLDVLKVLENNEKADPSKLAMIIYAHTPCEICRCGAVKLLQTHNAVPDWLPAECRYDSCEECREIFQETNRESSSETA